MSDLATRGIYERNPQRAHLSSYREPLVSWNTPAEVWWAFCAARPWLSGGFVWTGFDYRGEPEPYRHGRIGIASHYGIMDLCGFPKDHYWYYKAWWTDHPVLHLLPHWNWPGREGQEIVVWCYSNADEVELELNGTTLGRQTMPRHGRCEWKVPYAAGILLARGWRGGKRAETVRVETAGEPARIVLAPDRTTIAADGRDAVVINAAVVDARGRVVPTAENLVRFEARGGRILGVGNGDAGSFEPDKADRRKAFGGLCQVIVQAPSTAGVVAIRAVSQGLRPAAAKIRAGSVAIRRTIA